MSFVLQLGTVETLAPQPLERTSSNPSLGHQESSSPISIDATGSTIVVATTDDVSCEDRTRIQALQCPDASNSIELPLGHISSARSINLAYPVVSKAVKDGQRIAGSQTTTTQVLTTRVISQKLPTTAYPTPNASLMINTTSHIAHLSVNAQSLPALSNAQMYPVQSVVCSQNNLQSRGQIVAGDVAKQQPTTAVALQGNIHQKLQTVSAQQLLNNTAVKAITTAAVMSNMQRLHVKPQNLTGQPPTVNLQKVKGINNQTVAVQRNSVPRIQTVPKSQTFNSIPQGSQFANNQVTNNTRVPQGNSTNVQKTQQCIATPNSQKMQQQVYNNQKAPLLTGHSNHKAQHQQYSNNQPVQQNPQKGVQNQKTMSAQRQQQPATVNNVQKSGNAVTGMQKAPAHSQTVQQMQQQQQIQKQVPPSQRSQSTATLQKSQTMSAVNSARVQPMSNVCKSNSVPNISKIQQNSNILAIGKQQLVPQAQQMHTQPTPQLQQQLLHQNSQLLHQNTQQQTSQQQVTQKQQSAIPSPAQRSHSISNIHQKVATMATVQNNQRTQATMNSKMQQPQQPQQQQAPQQQQQQQSQQQQQVLMRVGVPKNQQNVQHAGMKSAPQKTPNVKSTNPQNPIQQQQQQFHRSSNAAQPVKIIQQQQQNAIGPQNAQKQPGCIKTIPPQKSAQRNHSQKVSGIKTSLNTNVAALKNQGSISAVAQKTSIKTLLPQQAVTPNMLVHKNTPVKIQQQGVQQKQLVMAPQYPQQVRQQAGQIKTLLPVTSTEPRKELENKSEVESRICKEDEQQQTTTPKSPVRRMPLPYECLQFVLQDHNYGAPPPRTPPPSSPPPHPKQQPVNGAGSSTTTSQHPYIYGQVVNNTNVEDDAASAISSETGREVEAEGEETETAPEGEGEGEDEDSVTRCICDFEHDDGYMICCDRCSVWQHVDCMGIDRTNIPDEYLCEICRPRRVDRQRARALQMRKREELLNSDTSSDTSSTSSADTDVGVNSAQKKRPLQQQVPRRKSESSSQVRRLNNNNNNNNNVAKRQRRDSHPRQSSAVRKKEVTKRVPGKRKAKRRLSVEEKEEETQDAWGSNMAPLRQWIERYEEAVTNHYSPELRARISSIKVNGTHSDLRQSNTNVVATGKCRLNVHSNNVRYLVATMYLPPNTPVVELRGKYMLSTQHRPSHPQGRQHAQRPGPFVFFYRLPRDGTEVCVDTRTYGNNARFVRRSCKPNAEVKHCIEKGTLHLYIVTTTAIEKNAEITIKHEQHDLLLSPNSSLPMVPVVCACNNPRECQLTTGQLNRRGSNGALIENADGRERRRRGRRNTISEDTDTISTVSSTAVTQVTPTPASSPAAPVPPRKTVTPAVTNTPTTRQTPKEEPVAPPQQSQTSPNISQPTPQETKKDKKKMTREERKMEAIMKAFERLEKAEQRKQEVQARNAQRKESGGPHSDNDEPPSASIQTKSRRDSERPLRRKRRKGRARTTSSSQSTRRTRLNSADSDVSSGDESNSMQSPPLSSQTRPPSRDAAYSLHLHGGSKDTKNSTDEKQNPGGACNVTSNAAGLLLALANSNAPGPSSPPLRQPTPVKSPTCDSGASSSSQSSTPSTPLSSACLLVAAAVGPLAPGFKFPKTKKVLMNEWLKESPDPPQTTAPRVSPLPALPSTSLTSSVNPLCRPSDFSLPAGDSSAEFLSQSYAAKSLATLVQAANSVSGICDSPPQRKQGATSGNTCPVSTGSAKKRWLRQAISEECDSPNSRPESPPRESEMVAPPKKRRIARESLSSDNYTPPTTPTMLHPETAPSRALCSTEDDFIEPTQSPNIEQNDERQFESEPTKEENNIECEPVDSDEAACQQKPLMNILQTDSHIKIEKSEDESMEISNTETSTMMKLENVEIKNEPIKSENSDIKTDCDLATSQVESKIFVKDESLSCKAEVIDCEKEKPVIVKKEIVTNKEEMVINKGTVEIVDQNEPDTEMEDLSSPIATMEPDAILKQRVAEMRLEFGGSIAEIVNIASENERSEDDKKLEDTKFDSKSDDNMSIDEFDMEAQMKKITGDDGNDYKEKVDTSSEKDKSMDGIEGLMESSKEDSESEDRDMDDLKYCESSFKLFNVNHDEQIFNEFDVKSKQIDDDMKEIETRDIKEIEVEKCESKKIDETSMFMASPEESIFESASSSADASDSHKIFHSIPPLSERIRKKVDHPPAPKKQLDFEAAIIESTINMETDETSNDSDKKSMLSTALRELLEAKLDDEPPSEVKVETVDENNTASASASSNASQIHTPSPEQTVDLQEQISKDNNQEPHAQETTAKEKEEETPPKEMKRLKDPRTVVPNSMPAPSAFKTDIPPVKRKLSISEYRKRKQQSSGTPPEPEPSNDASTDKGSARGRSDSASSGTSSLSSDEESSKMSLSLDLPGLSSLPLFTNAETDEKKVNEEGTIGWSAAPTLVERQRENLTERLKREFGLFLSDDEEERARKHGLTAEAILKTRKTSPSNSSVNSTPPTYPLPQLPPQPYIPPPGSAPIRYPQFQGKSCPVQYPSFAMPQTTSQPAYPSATPQVSAGKSPQQFLMPQAAQAPPGSNPYPPQFVPPSTTAVTLPKFSAVTPPPPPPPPPPHGAQVFQAAAQQQKPFFNHPAPRS